MRLYAQAGVIPSSTEKVEVYGIGGGPKEPGISPWPPQIRLREASQKRLDGPRHRNFSLIWVATPRMQWRAAEETPHTPYPS